VDEIISQNKTSLSVLDSLFENDEETYGHKDSSSDDDLDNVLVPQISS
jgi:hypothetical protein